MQVVARKEKQELTQRAAVAQRGENGKSKQQKLQRREYEVCTAAALLPFLLLRPL
jgi:hypothetical protein